MGFSRQEYWSELPFPSPGDLLNPGIERRSPALQADSLPAEPQGKPPNPEVDSLSLLQGILPTQESNWGLLHCKQILYQLSYEGSPKANGGGGLVTKSCPTLATPWTIACHTPLSMEFSRQEHWSGLPCPPPGDLPNPGMKPGSPALQTDSLPLEPPEKPLDNGDCSKHFMCQLF